ncbi:Tyrocidine synthase 3 [Actinosynnema sp. ALI-1.44]
MTPHAVASIDDLGETSYRELDLLSDELARRLVTATGGRRGAVVVRLPRGTGLVVALMGVLKAGCWYLPLSLDETAARVASMVSDADPVALVGVAGQVGGAVRHLPAVEVPDAVPLDQPFLDLPEVPPDYPVYVLFTSGSSGAPKGVLLGSGALCNRLLWMQRRYGLRPGDVVLQKTPVIFDVSGWEFFWPLITGARLAHMAEGSPRDPVAVADAVRRHGVTTCHFVPSMLGEFLRLADLGACTSLRMVFCSGEALPAGLAARFLGVLDASLHNLYGPTEAAIDVTHWEVPRAVNPTDTVYIGQPVDNTSLLVMDRRGTPTLPGEPGELWVGGAQLAIGYLNRPELTAAAFVERFGSRWYRTGDLVRAAEGRIEYLGRIDDQVKVRGVRVEPGEVEAVLGRHPAVGEAVVVAVPALRTEGHELLAALTAVDWDRPADGELISFLAAALPPSFVPSGFRWLDRMPATTSGKADRRRLRELLSAWWRAETEVGMDDDPVAELWWEVVRRPEDGDDESRGFVELGGHSLLAARLIGQTAERFGVRPSFSLLLRDNVGLAGFRAFIAKASREPGERASPHKSPLTGRVPLTAGQRRLWLVDQVEPRPQVYNVVAALRVRCALSVDAMRTALFRLVERHDVLRSRVRVDDDGVPWLSFTQPVRPVLEVRDLPRWDDGAARDFVRELADRPIAVVEAPLFRAGLLRTGDEEACLVLVQHHLIADQHSTDLLLADLAAAYAAEEGNRVPELDEAPSFAAYAEGQGSAAADDLAYWEEVLTGAPTELVLPFGGAVTEPGALGGDSCRHRLGADESRLVDALARHSGTTSATVVLAAVAAVLSQWTGQMTVIIGTPAARRFTSEEHRLVGFMVDTLPIRVDLPVGGTFADLLDHVGQRQVEALDHAVAEFDAVVDRLSAPRGAGGNPLFQVWFNDLSQAAPPPRLAGGVTEHFEVATGHALFDLNFYLRRGEDGYSLELVHRLDRMTSEVAAELLGQCLLVLAEVAVRPDVPLVELDLRTARAPAASPERWDTHTTPVGGVVERVLRVAAEQPNGPAFVSASGDVLTYRWLAEQVNEVVAALDRCGVRSGAVVEVRSARTAALAPALLGVWRRGAVAALVDATAPEALQAVQSATLRPAACLTVPTDPRARAVVEPASDEPIMLPGASHVLFTSGTTGRPAAVVVPEAALPNALAWYAAEFEPTTADRTALLSGPAHDPVLRDLLVALVSGGTVAVPPLGAPSDPAVLRDFLAELKPTILHATPALLEVALAGLEERPSMRLRALRLVVSGGAPLTKDLVRRLRRFTDAAVVNAYGATETPQVAALYPVLDVGEPLAGRFDGADALPIGTGVAGAQLLVLTPSGVPAGVGQLGELVVRGQLLATGYLDGTGPDERFGVDHSAGLPRRIFNTGDLARVDPAGVVHLAGRRDRQVSVNGFRVHLDQVEVVAQTHEDVRAARAEQVRDGGAEGLRLRVVGVPGGDLDPAAVRAHLRSLLPGAAVPVRIEVVRDLGTPALKKAGTGAQRAGEPPAAGSGAAQAVERALRARLQDVTGNELDRRENFFDAGLDSIALLRLHRSLQEEFGSFPVTAMFTHTTIASLAGFLAAIERPSASRSPVAVTPRARPAGRAGSAVKRRALRRAVNEGEWGKA